jgi:dephospho-CoA kinase
VTVGVTGSLASGKSTFVEFLEELGAETVSTDALVHELLAGDAATGDAVVERFGEAVRGEAGIDRRALAAEAFRTPEGIRDLEEILHPRVREAVGERIARSRAEVFVAEVPLLFEAGFGEVFDFTVAVVSSGERRLRWAEERGMGPEQVGGIEARQLPVEEKVRRAEVVVRNEGTLEELRVRAAEVYREALRRARDRQDEDRRAEH